MILKYIEKIYRKFKYTPLIGWFLVWLRNIIKSPILQRRRLRQRDFQKVHSIITELYGINSKAHNYLDDFYVSKIFKQKFSHGHSGDFDIMLLYIITKIEKPKVVIETGVASGRSSAAILQALHENNQGKLYSIDLPKFYNDKIPKKYMTEEGNSELKGFIPQGKKPGWLIPQVLRSRWKLILGDSKVELIHLFKKINNVDIFYHDSDHSYDSMMFEFQAAWKNIKSNGFLLSDDMTWNKAWDDFISNNTYAYKNIYRNFGILKK